FKVQHKLPRQPPPSMPTPRRPRSGKSSPAITHMTSPGHHERPSPRRAGRMKKPPRCIPHRAPKSSSHSMQQRKKPKRKKTPQLTMHTARTPQPSKNRARRPHEVKYGRIYGLYPTYGQISSFLAQPRESI